MQSHFSVSRSRHKGPVEVFLFPNSLRRYLDQSTFRKERSNGIADTEEKEIEILQRAMEDTI